MTKRTEAFPLRLPAFLRAAIADICREEGTSINQFVTTAVAEKISAMDTAEFFAKRGAEADIKAARRVIEREAGQPPEPEDRLDYDPGAPADIGVPLTPSM